mgnify:CR=1 FL=1
MGSYRPSCYAGRGNTATEHGNVTYHLPPHPHRAALPTHLCHTTPHLTFAPSLPTAPRHPRHISSLQFNSTSLNRHLGRAYNMGSGVRFGGDGFVEVLAATQTPTDKEWFQVGSWPEIERSAGRGEGREGRGRVCINPT